MLLIYEIPLIAKNKELITMVATPLLIFKIAKIFPDPGSKGNACPLLHKIRERKVKSN